MLVDILNRPLKPGDFVLYNRTKLDIPLQYGIVISDKAVFDGIRKYYYAEKCLLVTNLDEIEQKKYNELVYAYNQLELNKQKKKLRKLKQEEQVKYGLYRNGNTYYLYLGKMKYSDDFIAYRKIGEREVKFYGNSEGYAYYVFHKGSYSLKNVKNTMSFNILNVLYHKESSGLIDCHASATTGYRGIILYSKLQAYDEYIGEINVKGLYEPGKIYLYGSLLKEYGSDFKMYNEELYIESIKRCILYEI